MFIINIHHLNTRPEKFVILSFSTDSLMSYSVSLTSSEQYHLENVYLYL